LPGVLACDDGRVVKLGGGYTLLSCIHWERPYGLNDALTARVTVDGLDATSIASHLARILALRWDPEAILLDSIATAGFNLVSPATLYERTGVPVIVVYTYRPRTRRILEALEASSLPLRRVRERLLRLTGEVVPVETSRGRLYVIAWGTSIEYARSIIEYSQVYNRVPAPIRYAHYIASALSELLIR